MTHRIPVVGEPTDEQRSALERTGISIAGRPLNIFATMANHPALLDAINAFGGVFLAFGSLPPRVRELAILRVGSRSGSAYEVFHHSRIAREAGLSDPEIAAAQLALSARSWRPEEVMLLHFVDELFDDDVADETWAAVATNMDDSQMLELIMLVGFYRLLAIFLRAARVEIDEGTPTLVAPTT